MGIYKRTEAFADTIPGGAGIALGIAGLAITSVGAYLAGALFSKGIGKLLGVD